jgi:hypothetical protein
MHSGPDKAGDFDEVWVCAWENNAMKVATGKKAKSERDLLDHATDQLLRAVKARMLKKEGRVDYAKLRKEGYSDRFLARLESV